VEGLFICLRKGKSAKDHQGRWRGKRARCRRGDEKRKRHFEEKDQKKTFTTGSKEKQKGKREPTQERGEWEGNMGGAGGGLLAATAVGRSLVM